jgi:hypothetical protein
MSVAAPAAGPTRTAVSPRLLALGFAAGFLAVLVFHQGMLGLLHVAGVTPRAPFGMEPTKPLGVPVVLSAAFWGGVWGIPLTLLLARMPPRGAGYWLTALLFGAFALTLVAVVVVGPLKHQATAPAGQARMLATGLLVNAAWGIGTALFLWIFALRGGRSDA